MLILNDFSTSLIKAFNEIDSGWSSYEGLVVCGTHNPHDMGMMIDAIREARATGMPFLGICAGHQYAAIQYARDILGIKDATSEEFGEGTLVVKKRPQKLVGLHEGESYWSDYDVVIDWEKPDNFITVPYHPEYESSFFKPHPVLKQFLELCRTYTAATRPR